MNMPTKITNQQTFYNIGGLRQQYRWIKDNNIGGLKIRRKNKQQLLIKPTYCLRDLSDTNVYINDEKYTGQLRQCFIKAVSAQFRSLNLLRNMQSQILKQISHISFTHLRVLQLSGNYIDNIQPLGWMNIRGLRVLDLRQNYIVQTKSLAKLYTKSISQLKIGLNLMNSLQSLTRMKFRVNQGNRDLSLLSDTALKPYKYPVNNLSFLAKLDQPQGLQQQWINIYHKNRININKLYKSILRRGNKKKSIVLSYQLK